MHNKRYIIIEEANNNITPKFNIIESNHGDTFRDTISSIKVKNLHDSYSLDRLMDEPDPISTTAKSGGATRNNRKIFTNTKLSAAEKNDFDDY